ncbi:MAG: chemotaxis protein CheW [Acidobacteriota bacterium]
MKKDKKGRRPVEEPQPTEPSAAAGPEDEKTAAETAREESDAPAETAAAEPARPSLPAFGFAADLLRSAGKAGPGDTAEIAGSSAGDAPLPGGGLADRPSSLDSVALDAGAAGQLTAAGAAAEAAQPTRIFDFADQVAGADLQAQEQAAPVQLDTFVTFALAGETFAMPVHPVRQVFRVSTITRVPHAPRPIRGVTNYRGRVLPLIDLRLRVGLEETELQRSSRVISVSSRGRLIGLLVDAVHQVVHLDVLRVQPPPDDVMTVQSDYIQGVYGEGEDLILLLDIDRTLIIREAGAA